MGFLKRIWDGGLSLLAGIAVMFVAFVPAWFTHIAASANLAPGWSYICAGLLALGAATIAVDFWRKGLRGIAPARSRRRT
ncbi:MAG: hypothetical protein AAGA12_11495 [Pseudomonadota bacterium]